MSLTALIVDGEGPARQRVLDFLEQEKDVTCVGECGSAAVAIETILRKRPDVLFLNIQMPELDGFRILDAVREHHLPAVVFTTTHDGHATRAFEFRAVDYLLKPFSKSRFEQALSRLKESDNLRARAESRSLSKEGSGNGHHPEKISFKANGRIVILATDAIEWIEAERDYVRICTQTGSYLVRGTMTETQSMLPSHNFVRIHRSTIVNVEHVSELRPAQRGEYSVKLRSGTERTLSRTHRDTLARLIG